MATQHFMQALSFDDETWKRLNILKNVDARADGNRSRFVRNLINDEWERRGLAGGDEHAVVLQVVQERR